MAFLYHPGRLDFLALEACRRGFHHPLFGMELFYHPDRLASLAVEALGEYIADLLIASRHLENVDQIKQTLEYLDGILQDQIPSPLAHDVTNKLIACIYSVWSDRLPSDIKSQAINTVLLPSIETIDCLLDNPHPSALEYYYRPVISSDLETVCLQKLRKLRVLRLDFDICSWTSMWVVMNKYVFENLEKLSFKGRNSMLEDLSKFCPQLRSLDVSDCDMGVTNESVDYILSFRCLEDLNLDCTYISEDGLTGILEGISQSSNGDCLSMRLKSFGCCRPSQYHLNLIVDKFKNITSLSLSWFRDGNLIPLKGLKYLRSLSLKFMVFLVAQDFLKAIGEQLLTLELNQVYDADLRVVCISCPNLKCFHFKYTVSPGLGYPMGMTLIPYSEQLPLPKFESVTCLSMKVNFSNFTRYVVSRFVNVTRLYVLEGGTLALLDDILRRENLKYLEHYFWKSQGKSTEVELYEKHALIRTHDYEKGEWKLRSTKIKS